MRLVLALGLVLIAASAHAQNPVAPTPPSGDCSNRIATTQYVCSATGGTGSGTVISVGLTVPPASLFGVTGSPVTVSGNLGLTTAGTSGGVPYFSSTSALNSSALLALDQLVLGGGAGAPPFTLGSLGTTTTVLHGNAAGIPSFGPVANTDLVNSSITVSSQTCVLGGSCTIAAGNLAAIAANTYLGNATSGMANPSAIAIGSCSGAHHALQYTTNVGLTCATDIADLDQENSFTAHQEPVPVALTDGATITPLGTDANLYTLTVAGNSHVLQCPTTIRRGTYNFRITNSGGVTGFTTVTSSCYRFPGGTQPSWSTTTGAVDVLSCSAFDTSHLECNALINLL